MRNITFSADPGLIERARARAHQQKKTLNAAFREWLERYAGVEGSTGYRQLMERFDHVRPGRKFDRDEMNSRPRR